MEETAAVESSPKSEGETVLDPPTLAHHILSGIARTMAENHSHIPDLFKQVNRGTPAVLELEEFIEGLVKINAFEDVDYLVQLAIIIRDTNGQRRKKKEDEEEEEEIDAAPLKVLEEAMTLIDPEFEGRVTYTALGRGVASFQATQRKQMQSLSGLSGRGPKATASFYGGELPVEVVRVDKLSKSVFDFNRSRDLFFKQQSSLLAFHGERKD
jgi:hypothetical protein